MFENKKEMPVEEIKSSENPKNKEKQLGKDLSLD